MSAPPARPPDDTSDTPAPQAERAERHVRVVGVGASAGGLEALTALLGSVPADARAAFVVVQHLAPGQPSALVELLAHATKLCVRQAADGMKLAPGCVYVVAPDSELTVTGLSLAVTQPRASGLRRPIDALFRSLATSHGGDAMAVLLSGADVDGTEGMKAVKEAGGVTFAQDDTARFPTMPRSAVESGAVDYVMAPDAIGRQLASLVERDEHEGAPADGRPAPVAGRHDDAALEQAIELLRDVEGLDLTQYKRMTLRRRVLRRMALGRFARLDDFVQRLREDPAELAALRSDVLIHVTSFFRDPDAFAALEAKVFPELMRGRTVEPIRVWVPACSTGEEAYSIAMALSEFLGRLGSTVPVQVFATDVDEAAVADARAGSYPLDIAREVSPERLRRSFVKHERGFQVGKAIRDLCVFAPHDISRDPPFSRIDLVSCRNLLIYLGPVLQKRALSLFHYALRPNGFLLLGRSETPGEAPELFAPVDPNNRIYSRKEVLRRPDTVFGPPRPMVARREMHEAPRVEKWGWAEVQREADRMVLEVAAPPGVIVDDQLNVIQFRGRTAPYLEPAEGKASYKLLSMAHEGLAAELAAVVAKVREQATPAEARAVFEADGRRRDVLVKAMPLGGGPAGEHACTLVLFEQASPRATVPDAPAGGPQGERIEGEAAQTIARLRHELAATRRQLHASIEEHESTLSELQSAHEEVLSGNEELQSTNEELETAKEELESTNEQLESTNEQLRSRNAELGQVADDLGNLMSSLDVAIVMLGRDLTIRRFTPMAATLFNLIPTDVGRPITDLNLSIGVSDLDREVSDVLDTLRIREREVQDRKGRWFTLRVRPYRTSDDRIDGAVMILTDVDALKLALGQSERARDYADAIVATVRHAIIVLDRGLRVVRVNPAYRTLFDATDAETIGRRVAELGGGQWGAPELGQMLERVLSGRETSEELELEREFPRIGRRVMLVTARRFEPGLDGEPQLLLSAEDVTVRTRVEAAMRERDALVHADLRKNEFLAMLAHELRNPLTPIVNAVQLLARPEADAPAGQHQRLLEMLGRQTSRLTRLIDDLLDVSRVTRGKVELKKSRVDLRTTVEAAVEMTKPLIDGQRHDLTVSLPPTPLWVDGDAARLEQIAGNLLSNAARYTNRGGHIWLTAEREGAGMAILRVRDTGIGMTRETIEHVFDLFAQGARPSDRAQGGLGIGLTVVRELVQLHGGTVEARSDGPDRGSEFIVRIPLAAEQPVTADSEPSAPVGGEGRDREATEAAAARRVLVVEDNADVAESLAALIRSWGHDVRSVSDGPSAIDVAGAFAPDVVLLDIGLPGMDGYEVARRIHANERCRYARIVALTGYGLAQDVARSMEAGIDEHLVKPCDPDTIRRVVGRAGGASPPPSQRRRLRPERPGAP